MILEAQHICKNFDGRQVLADLTFGVDAGEVVGLLGNNGAGKTTLLRIITALMKPDSGSVLFDGHPLTHADLSQIGYLPEERGLYRHMAAGLQAVYLMRLKGLGRRKAVEVVHRQFEHFGIMEWWDRPVGRLSKGMQQKLQYIVTVAHSPRLVILDEPFSGLDEPNAATLKAEVAALRAAGTAVILSTHNLQAAAELCDRTIRL